MRNRKYEIDLRLDAWKYINGDNNPKYHQAWTVLQVRADNDYKVQDRRKIEAAIAKYGSKANQKHKQPTEPTTKTKYTRSNGDTIRPIIGGVNQPPQFYG